MRRTRAEIIAWLREQPEPYADDGLAQRLKAAFPGVSDATLRRALLESGIGLHPFVEGVRQDSREHLERTLLALAAAYESGGPAIRARLRLLVLTAYRHARFAARRKPKQEDLLWLKTWLENPPVFPEWLRLRKRACGPSPDEM